MLNLACVGGLKAHLHKGVFLHRFLAHSVLIHEPSLLRVCFVHKDLFELFEAFDVIENVSALLLFL